MDEGFDLVVFSGGKGMLGPQASGLLLGRKDLVAAAQKAISPNGGIGRGMKVGKEEIAGLVAAVERYLRVDHEAEHRTMEKRAEEVIALLAGIKGITARKEVPEIANHVPHVSVTWQGGTASPPDVVRLLREGNPIIHVGSNATGLLISMFMLRGDEHRIVARRLKEVLSRSGSPPAA